MKNPAKTGTFLTVGWQKQVLLLTFQGMKDILNTGLQDRSTHRTFDGVRRD